MLFRLCGGRAGPMLWYKCICICLYTHPCGSKLSRHLCMHSKRSCDAHMQPVCTMGVCRELYTACAAHTSFATCLQVMTHTHICTYGRTQARPLRHALEPSCHLFEACMQRLQRSSCLWQHMFPSTRTMLSRLEILVGRNQRSAT